MVKMEENKILELGSGQEEGDDISEKTFSSHSSDYMDEKDEQ